jgi:hypothetical protein
MLRRETAGKAIEVPEVFRFSHAKFIALFLNPLQAINPSTGKAFGNSLADFYPLDLQKTHFRERICKYLCWKTRSFNESS